MKRENCVLIIAGPSGAGKTTVLNILGGMDTLTDGKIRLGGEEISAYNERKLTGYRRHDVGFVLEFYNLVPNLTALENVELAAQICTPGLRLTGPPNHPSDGSASPSFSECKSRLPTLVSLRRMR